MACGMLFALVFLATESLVGATVCKDVTVGDVAPSKGVFIEDGKSPVDAVSVVAGSAAPDDGKFCEGCVIVQQEAVAPSAGQLVTANAVFTLQEGESAPHFGFLCQDGSVGAGAGGAGPVEQTPVEQAPAPAPDCVIVTAGAEMPSEGLFVGEGDPVLTPEVSVAPTRGYFCEGCVLAEQGDVAPSAGSFYVIGSRDATMLKEGDSAPSNGVWCQGGSGIVPAMPPSASSDSTKFSISAVAFPLLFVAAADIGSTR